MPTTDFSWFAWLPLGSRSCSNKPCLQLLTGIPSITVGYSAYPGNPLCSLCRLDLCTREWEKTVLCLCCALQCVPKQQDASILWVSNPRKNTLSSFQFTGVYWRNLWRIDWNRCAWKQKPEVVLPIAVCTSPMFTDISVSRIGENMISTSISFLLRESTCKRDCLIETNAR